MAIFNTIKILLFLSMRVFLSKYVIAKYGGRLAQFVMALVYAFVLLAEKLQFQMSLGQFSKPTSMTDHRTMVLLAQKVEWISLELRK